jgi:hypothetical protein
MHKTRACAVGTQQLEKNFCFAKMLIVLAKKILKAVRVR